MKFITIIERNRKKINESINLQTNVAVMYVQIGTFLNKYYNIYNYIVYYGYLKIPD